MQGGDRRVRRSARPGGWRHRRGGRAGGGAKPKPYALSLTYPTLSYPILSYPNTYPDPDPGPDLHPHVAQAAALRAEAATPDLLAATVALLVLPDLPARPGDTAGESDAAA
mgnify:FL=1